MFLVFLITNLPSKRMVLVFTFLLFPQFGRGVIWISLSVGRTKASFHGFAASTKSSTSGPSTTTSPMDICFAARHVASLLSKENFTLNLFAPWLTTCVPGTSTDFIRQKVLGRSEEH